MPRKLTHKAFHPDSPLRAIEAAGEISVSEIADASITAAKLAPGAAPTPSAVSDQNNTSTGYFDLPSGTTAQRPESPNAGYLRHNSETGYLEQYDGTSWQALATPPTIDTISPTTYNGESGSVITVNGSNFDSSSVVRFITSGGTTVAAGTTTFVSSIQLTATTPQDFTVADEPISIEVVVGSGLSSRLDNALDAGGAPTWATASGQIASVLTNEALTTSVSATDPEGGAVTYAHTVGDLSPFAINSSTGAITGTAPSTAGTKSFTITASDPVNNSTDRPFSILVINPVTDSGNGQGYAAAYSTNTTNSQITNNTQTAYNTPQAANPHNTSYLWNWAWEPSYTSTYFAAHSGHDGNQDYYAVQVSTGTPVVANAFDWRKHVNAVGTVYFYGSNQNITSFNFTDYSNLWTYLGSAWMGGEGSAGDGNTSSTTLNSNLYGYRWYMVRTIDNNGSTMGGWAMYSARFKRT